MADFYAGFSALPQYQLHARVVQSSQNVPGNYSTDSWWEWVEKLSGSGYYTGSSGNSGGISGDISGGAGGWAPYDFTSYSSLLIGSGSGNIAHNADGTKTASGSFSASDSAGGNMGSASGSWALAQTPIPRQAFKRSSAGGTFDKNERLDRLTPTASQQKLERWSGSAWVRQG